MRRAAKIDLTQNAIVDALRKVGVSVEVIGKPVDLLICHKGETALMECKSAEGRLTKDQVEFIARWPGKVHVAYDEHEAVAMVLGPEVMA